MATYGDKFGKREAVCFSCHKKVTPIEGAPPTVDDDEAWSDIALEHKDGCRWVMYRAYQVEPFRLV